MLYLVRHGETEWNRQRRMPGRLDSRLTPEGRAHARMHGRLLARETVGHMIVSPLGRTRETAELILEGCDVPVTYDERLVERHCGDWEGLTIDEIAVQFPEDGPPGRSTRSITGRPRAKTCRTCCGALHRSPTACTNYRCRRLAIVSHGISGRVLLTHFLGLKPSGSRSRPATERPRVPPVVLGRRGPAITFAAATVRIPGFSLHAPDQVG